MTNHSGMFYCGIRYSLFPRKCDYCRRKIRKGTPHVVLIHKKESWARYCDVQCARLDYEKAMQNKWDMIETIFGGEK